MLAVTASDDAEMLTLIITNEFSTTASTKFSVTLPADASLQTLHEKCAEVATFMPGTFELTRKSEGGLEEVHRLADAGAETITLTQAGIQNKGRIKLCGMDGNAPMPYDNTKSSSAVEALGQVALWSSQNRGETPFYGPLARGATTSGSSSLGAPSNANGFVGLVNQGATCYLSSLLQSLFMTPDFRRLLYDATPPLPSAPADGMAEDGMADGILFQLQKLFVSLQTSGAHAIDTKELTRSFGWDQSDAFTQHDVQELLRVLFDALETELDQVHGGGGAAALQKIYRGKWTDYVQCKVCLHQSSNPSTFDDINLAIRAFDEQQTPFTSLEAALAAFLEPETLDGDNAYYCEKCNCKRPALKGTRLLELPPVLCVGLKRFDFDFQTLSRVKLHHPVAIPSLFDAAPFLDGGEVARQHTSTKRKLVGATTPNSTPLTQPAPAEAAAAAVPLMPLPPAAGAGGAADASADVEMKEADASRPQWVRDLEMKEAALAAATVVTPPVTQFDLGHPIERHAAAAGVPPPVTSTASGSSIASAASSTASAFTSSSSSTSASSTSSASVPYELFSLLMHSGSASFGHYFAYIKALSSGVWYKFNDSHVTLVSDEQIKAAMGGDGGSGPTAYMCLLRKVDPKRGGAAAAGGVGGGAEGGEVSVDELLVEVPERLKELVKKTSTSSSSSFSFSFHQQQQEEDDGGVLTCTPCSGAPTAPTELSPLASSSAPPTDMDTVMTALPQAPPAPTGGVVLGEIGADDDYEAAAAATRNTGSDGEEGVAVGIGDAETGAGAGAQATGGSEATGGAAATTGEGGVSSDVKVEPEPPKPAAPYRAPERGLTIGRRR